MSDRDDDSVDVILPVYNGLPYLRQAVESVLAQTHTALNLYVVDDGSTDGVADYIASVEDGRLTLFTKPNGGLSSARNFGILHSSAPYVAFLDADDVWYPEKLRKQLALLRRRPTAGLVHAYQHFIDDTGRIIGSAERSAQGYVFDELLNGNIVTGSASIAVVRRDALDRVGTFREDLTAGEDWEMWLRIAEFYEFDCVPEHLAAIRQWHGSMQQDALRMANAFSQLHTIVMADFELSPTQRVQLARFCLLGSASEYFRGGNSRSRRLIVRYLREVPADAVDPRWWALIGRYLLGPRAYVRLREAGSRMGIEALDRTARRLGDDAEALARIGRRRHAALLLLAAVALAPWRKRNVRRLLELI